MCNARAAAAAAAINRKQLNDDKERRRRRRRRHLMVQRSAQDWTHQVSTLNLNVGWVFFSIRLVIV